MRSETSPAGFPPSTSRRLPSTGTPQTLARAHSPSETPPIRREPGPLRNPGWETRIAEGTLWSFATGLAGGAAYCVYHESLDFSHNIAAIAGNVTIAGVAFLSAKELTRLVRQTDDWMNSATAGAMVGSQLAVMQRGPRYSAAGAALCGGVAPLLVPFSSSSSSRCASSAAHVGSASSVACTTGGLITKE